MLTPTLTDGCIDDSEDLDDDDDVLDLRPLQLWHDRLAFIRLLTTSRRMFHESEDDDDNDGLLTCLMIAVQGC